MLGESKESKFSFLKFKRNVLNSEKYPYHQVFLFWSLLTKRGLFSCLSRVGGVFFLTCILGWSCMGVQFP